MELKRTTQCAKCPWRVDCDPHEIPDGYSADRHEDLEDTIADGDDIMGQLGSGELRVMACHESPVGDETPCIGWLMNQLGPGNNIALRLAVRKIGNMGEVQLVGEQHSCFEDTLPEYKKE